MIHVTPINDEDWQGVAWAKSAASATCDADGCDGFQLIGIFPEDAWSATLKYGEIALRKRLESTFKWRGGLCPRDHVVDHTSNRAADVPQDSQNCNESETTE